MVDAAAKLATLVPQRAPTVDAALAYLDATGDTTVGDHLADLGGAGAVLRPTSPPASTGSPPPGPAVDPGWWPRVEEPVRARWPGRGR